MCHILENSKKFRSGDFFSIVKDNFLHNHKVYLFQIRMNMSKQDAELLKGCSFWLEGCLVPLFSIPGILGRFTL